MRLLQASVTDVTQIREIMNYGPGPINICASWDETAERFIIFQCSVKTRAKWNVMPIVNIYIKNAGALSVYPASVTFRYLAGVIERIVLGVEAETSRILKQL